MSRRKKTKGSAGWLVVGVAFVAWVGGCVNPEEPKPSAAGVPTSNATHNFVETPAELAGQHGVPTGRSAGSAALFTRDGGIISNVNVWHPKQALLTKALMLKIRTPGNSLKTEEFPAGTVVAVQGVDKELLFVEFRGITQKIPAGGTDFAAQMAAVQTSP